MDTSGNRFGRTVWTVWGYLSGAVARYLRPDVTDEASQNFISEDADIKQQAKEVDKEVDVKKDLQNEPTKYSSVHWNKGNADEDHNNVKLNVDQRNRQAHHCAVWSLGTVTGDDINQNTFMKEEDMSSEELNLEITYSGIKQGNKQEPVEAWNSDDEVCDIMCDDLNSEPCVNDLEEEKIEHSEPDTSKSETGQMDWRSEEKAKSCKGPETFDSALLADASEQHGQENTPEAGVELTPEITTAKDILASHIFEPSQTNFGHQKIQAKIDDHDGVVEQWPEKEIEVNPSDELHLIGVVFEADEDVAGIVSGTQLRSLKATEVLSFQEKDENKNSLKVLSELSDKAVPVIHSEDKEGKAFHTDSCSYLSVVLKEDNPTGTQFDCRSPQATVNVVSEPLEESVISVSEPPQVETEHVHVESGSSSSLTSAEVIELQHELENQKPIDEQHGTPTDLAKAALTYVEDITNHILQEMIDAEMNWRSHEGSTEDLAKAEHQELADCTPAEASVQEQDHVAVEWKLSDETVGRIGEMVDSALCEAVNKQMHEHPFHQIISPESETTEIDGSRDQEKTLRNSPDDITDGCRSGTKRPFDKVTKDIPDMKMEEKKPPLVATLLDLQVVKDSALNFSVQKSRIAVKNPHLRPPKDPRGLLNKASVEPLEPKTPSCGLVKHAHSGHKEIIGIKLPGLGPGFQTLRKTEFGKRTRDGQESESSVQRCSAADMTTQAFVKPEQVSAKPKWTPPRQPGMASPMMMAELKNKLKKHEKD